jgi:hypothetical protein
VFCNGDASGLYISLREADSLILVTKLSNKTGMNIPLEESGIDMNIPSELATFVEGTQSE